MKETSVVTRQRSSPIDCVVQFRCNQYIDMVNFETNILLKIPSLTPLHQYFTHKEPACQKIAP